MKNKTCTKCKKALPLSSFHRDKTKPDGFYPSCKVCRKPNIEKDCISKMEIRNRDLLLQIKEGANQYSVSMGRYILFLYSAWLVLKEQRKQKRSENYKRRWKERYTSNLEFVARHRERSKEYYNEHSAERMSYIREYRRANPEKVSLWSRVSSANRRSRLLRAEGSLKGYDVFSAIQSQQGRCRYCGRSLYNTIYEIDHVIPLSRGGSNLPDNLVVACRPCNRSKQSKTPSEWSPLDPTLWDGVDIDSPSLCYFNKVFPKKNSMTEG